MTGFIESIAQQFGITNINCALLIGIIVGIIIGRVARANPNAKAGAGMFTSSSTNISISQMNNPALMGFERSGAGQKIELDTELSLKLRELLQKNNKIEAIKLLREEKKLELIEAKQLVESLEMAFKNFK